MVLPHEHVIRLYSVIDTDSEDQDGAIEARCTCGDFSIVFPDGIDLANVEGQSPTAPNGCAAVTQHREFHARQNPHRELETDAEDPDDPTLMASRRQVRREAYDTRMLTEGQVWEASGLTQSRLAVAHVAQILDDRAQALRREAGLKTRTRHDDPRPRQTILLLSEEMALLAHTLDSNYGWEPDR